MSKLIDADSITEKIMNVFEEALKIALKSGTFDLEGVMLKIKCYLDNQPTAFDVDKVLKKISERNREYQEKYRECQKEEREMAEEIFYQRAKTMAEAYDIVKAGGTDGI